MKFQPPRGTKDYLPEEMVRREYVIQKIRKVFETYGFDLLETPIFENFQLLAAKSGVDVKEEIFQFEDKGGRKLGLRFDLTVSLARVVAANPQLPKPFKRYYIAPAWRYEEPQAGRMRQFWQADIDICGSESMEADVECIAAAVDCLKALGFEEFTIKVNNRKALDEFLDKIRVDKEKSLDVFRAIDKLEKAGKGEVKNQLEKVGLISTQIDKLLKFIDKKGSFKKVLSEGKKLLKDSEGIKELEELYKFAKIYGIAKLLVLDYSLSRGLDYYTGPVYEIAVETGKQVGSVAGGGRYDNLIEIVGGVPTPATGISLGLERIVEILEAEKKLDLPETKVKLFVANVNEDVKKDTLKIARKLRKKNIACQIDLMNRNLTRQLEYADSSKIPYVLIVGPKELKSKKFKLRDMKNKTEKELSMKEIIKIVK